ncbi:MAG: 2-hydroxyhepta-2,4-diene-1,7-dioate isomerase [Sphingobacteriaceae bacterium]|nr:2-hydroxyhepta-2,4-diene-1,7-dioate isomerase [Sphingobacteriaceae bacterium]
MKIICVGRNYADHARELNNEVPTEPVIFLKPDSAILKDGKAFYLPDHLGSVHHELEIVLRICKNGKHISPKFAADYYDQIGLGIDFTARDLQTKLKNKGLPWELAKGFDGSAVLGDFVPKSQLGDMAQLQIELLVNGEKRQAGNTRDLLFSFEAIIVFVSQYFTLRQGDLIYTGTPAGVGPVQPGDILEGYLNGEKRLYFQVK